MSRSLPRHVHRFGERVCSEIVTRFDFGDLSAAYDALLLESRHLTREIERGIPSQDSAKRLPGQRLGVGLMTKFAIWQANPTPQIVNRKCLKQI